MHGPDSGRPHLSPAALIARNSAFIFMARLIEVGFGLVSIALIARYLDVELYGLYAYLTSIVAVVIPLAYFGLQRILIRDIARDRSLVARYLGTAIIGRTAFSAALVAAVVAFVVLSGFDRVSAAAILVFLASEILLSYVTLFVSVYTALERMGIDTVLTTASRLFNLAVLLLVIYLDLGFVSIFASMLLSSVFTLALTVAATRKGLGAPDLTYDRALMRYFVKESYPLVAVAFLTAALFRVDIFVLKYFRGMEEISLFFAPHSIITRLQVVPLALTTAIFPSLSRSTGAPGDAFHSMYSRAFKLLFVVSLPVSVAAFAFAEEFIVLFFGAAFAGSAPAFRLLIWTVNLMFLECLLGFVLLAMHEQRFTAINTAVILAINFGLDLLLVPGYGFMGAAAATLVAYVLRTTFSYAYVSMKTAPLPLASIVLKPALGGAVMYLAAVWLKGYSPLAALAASGAAYAAVLLVTRHFAEGELSFLGDKLMRRQKPGSMKVR